MADFSEYFYYDMINISSIVLAALLFVAVIMIYFGSVTRRITRLARDVSRVAEGDMSGSIGHDGGDEIATLAANVENMRTSILENLERERAAREANLELITSMSHDIRTPLTILLGYLDMMKQGVGEEALGEYIDASERTAMRLKTLSDGMFNYFLLFSDRGDAELSPYDARTFFEQLLSEFALLFRERGYEIDRRDSAEALAAYPNYTVLTDAPEAMRVVENLFSNIGKYADKSAPVSIYLDFEDGKYKLKITNCIAEDASRAESSGIGLKTCRKLAERIFSRFRAERVEDAFESVF